MAPTHVLVVDDEPTILALLKLSLSKAGALVEVADGPAAIRLLGERAFDFVLSDTQMPGADGLEVLEAAKRLCPNATRVLMSGDPGALARGEDPDSPAQHLLAKPIDLGRLHRLLQASTRPAFRPDELLESIRRRYSSSSDAVFVKDTKGLYLFMNTTGASLLLRLVPEIVGRLDSEIFDRATLIEEVRASDQEVLRRRRHYLYVNATRNPGTARTFLSAKLPVFDARGEIRAIGCLSRDVTELMGPDPGDRSEQIDALLRDLQEASSILAAGANAIAIERQEVERCLQEPREEKAMTGTRGHGQRIGTPGDPGAPMAQLPADPDRHSQVAVAVARVPVSRRVNVPAAVMKKVPAAGAVDVTGVVNPARAVPRVAAVGIVDVAVGDVDAVVAVTSDRVDVVRGVKVPAAAVVIVPAPRAVAMPVDDDPRTSVPAMPAAVVVDVHAAATPTGVVNVTDATRNGVSEDERNEQDSHER
ncbi:MAG: response regulator [Planctomycetota bacterium]